MGGFTINGCGAADSYYPIKDLHTAHCPSCGRERMFALMELKRKVKVFYIPTFSVGSKFAVVCSHCKDGWYITDEQKAYILSHPAEDVQIDSNGVCIQSMEAAEPVAEVPAATSEPETPTAPTPARICTCGAVLAENAIFCSQCGKRYEAPIAKPEPKPEPEHKPELKTETTEASAPKVPSVDVLAAMRRKKICPACRMMFPLERQVCPICDSPLEEKK